jgi:RNA polymerase sigma factor (sigma-70 family)
VTGARKGDKKAWDALVERYAPLIWSICRRHRLTSAESGDAGQRVWLQLVTHLNQIRDPAAVPGWLATTTHRECRSIQRAARRWQPLDRVLNADRIPGQRAEEAEHELLAAERHAALHEAFTRLPSCWQQLIAALIEDRPCRTPRSAPSWASRPGASGQRATAAWTSCAAIRRLLP